MKKRIIAMLSVMAILAATLTGCGGSETPIESTAPSESSADNAEESVKESAEDMTITISVQNGQGVEAAWKAVADAYTAKNPGVNVVVDLKPVDGYDEWVKNAFQTDGSSADIVNINLAGDTKVGKSINFNEYIENDSPYSDGIWKDQFEYSAQRINMSTGEFDALSLESVQVLWLYNMDIFNEVGVDVPTTWDELIEVSEKILAAGYQPLAIPGDYESFYGGKIGWLAQIYADQTTRSMVEIVKAQPGDFCYDPDIDGLFKYDPSDPFNDDANKVTQNAVRAMAAVRDGKYTADTAGMRTVWNNFAEAFPKYAGGEAFWGTDDNGAKSLFYQGKAAMRVDGGWGIVNFMSDMKALAESGEILDSNGDVIENAVAFELGSFNMPSMEGDGIEAKARTIEVPIGFLGGISKSQEHDDLVVDFLMFYSSQEGMSEYVNAALADGFVPNGPSLVYGVQYPDEINAAYEKLTFIGNCQKDFANLLARGIGESAETFRAFYDYSQEFLRGNISIEDWITKHQKNIMDNLESTALEKGVGLSDLDNPENEPTGK